MELPIPRTPAHFQPYRRRLRNDMRPRDRSHARPPCSHAEAQLYLFPDLIAQHPPQREACKQRKGTTNGKLRIEADLEPVQRIVPAAGASLPRSLGPCSVFAMASALPRCSHQTESSAEQPAPFGGIIVREVGITRHTAIRLQDTEEWAEKERQRRARQKPPRPPRQKFKMKGSRAWAVEQ